MKKMMVDEDQLMKLKHKRKTDESAVASVAVKLKLRECLLNKSRLEAQISTESTSGSSQWSSIHHSSLENHSPPTTSKWSPPLNLLNQLDDEYPLRKTVSEPSLKIKTCKMSLRQRVMQRNSQLMRRRELYRRKAMVNCAHMAFDHDSSPNSPSLFDSHGSSIDESKVPIPMDTARLAENYISKVRSAGIRMTDPLSSCHYGSLPQVRDVHLTSLPYPALPILSQDIINSFNNNININANNNNNNIGINNNNKFHNINNNNNNNKDDNNTATNFTNNSNNDFFPYKNNNLVTGSSCDVRNNIPPSPSSLIYPPPIFNPRIDPETYLQVIMLARSSLPRTRSEPIPLPVQLLLQQHMFKKQEVKDPTKYLLKQKLLQQAGVKKHMENLDESIENHLLLNQNHQTYGEDTEDDVMILEEEEGMVVPKGREDGGAHDSSSSISSLMTSQHLDFSSLLNSSDPSSSTGLVFEENMLKHTCLCGNNNNHPENPHRIVAILQHFQQLQLINKCKVIKARKAMCEELQSCHSEAYVSMYAGNPRTRDASLNETFESRLCKMACGGVGVDTDTVWNHEHTAVAARLAAGGVIELSHRVATGEVRNGFAVVRPPGHHAEDTLAMGFCYFNSIGVAVKQLLDKTPTSKILIVDWDVHHGNSTQQIFYADPRVLYISLHRYDNGNFFPGTGDPREIGIHRGEGFNVNISFSDAPMSDADYLAAFRSIVMPISREFCPEIVMVSAGFDASLGHPAPLGGYSLSPACFGHMTRELMSLCEERVVLVLEGGYELAPLSLCASQCLKALLHLPMDEISSGEMNKLPCQQAIHALQTTFSYQAPYWPCLHTCMPSISLSQQQFLTSP